MDVQCDPHRHPWEAISECPTTTALDSLASPSPPGRLLGHGGFLTLLTAAGTGGSWFGKEALTRWRGDRVADGDGWLDRAGPNAGGSPGHSGCLAGLSCLAAPWRRRLDLRGRGQEPTAAGRPGG